MKKTTKSSYAPPALEVMAVRNEGVLCGSGNVPHAKRAIYGDAIEDLWEE